MQHLILSICFAFNLKHSKIMRDRDFLFHRSATSWIVLIISPKGVETCRIYVCMYVCMYACMYVCMHVCMYVCMDECMYVCMYVLVRACDCLCVSVCGFIQRQTDGHIHGKTNG